MDETDIAIIAEEEVVGAVDVNAIRTEDGKFACRFCAQLFKSRSNCVNHLSNDHGIEISAADEPDEVDLNECSFCGSIFKWKKNLHRHIRRSHHVQPEEPEREKDGPFVCSECRTPFTSISNLNRHCRTKHYGKGQRPNESVTSQSIACPMCNQTFCSEASLQCHTRIYHKIVFVSSGSTYTRKMRERFYQFSCKICNLKLKKRFHINRHVVSKHGVEPSKDNVSLVTIVRNTNKELSESFSCQECNEEFDNESSWGDHMKIFHEQQPETCCSICGAHSFIFMKDLQCHLKDVHNISHFTIDEDREFVRLHGSTLGLRDAEMHALSKIPEWLVKRANGQLVIAVYRS